MEGQPHIHFIEAKSIPECEQKVNGWIDNLDFCCSVLHINVMPMVLGGELVYVTVVTFLPKPSYIPAGGPG